MNRDDEVTLKEYFESRLQEIEKATDRTAEQLNKRLEGMNEFRDTLKDQAAKFVTRDTLDVIIDKLNVDIKNLTTAKDVLSGKASQNSVLWAYAVAVIGIVIGIIGLVR